MLLLIFFFFVMLRLILEIFVLFWFFKKHSHNEERSFLGDDALFLFDHLAKILWQARHVLVCLFVKVAQLGWLGNARRNQLVDFAAQIGQLLLAAHAKAVDVAKRRHVRDLHANRRKGALQGARNGRKHLVGGEKTGRARLSHQNTVVGQLCAAKLVELDSVQKVALFSIEGK